MTRWIRPRYDVFPPPGLFSWVQFEHDWVGGRKWFETQGCDPVLWVRWSQVSCSADDLQRFYWITQSTDFHVTHQTGAKSQEVHLRQFDKELEWNQWKNITGFYWFSLQTSLYLNSLVIIWVFGTAPPSTLPTPWNNGVFQETGSRSLSSPPCSLT